MRVQDITEGRAISIEVECIGSVPADMTRIGGPAPRWVTKYDGSLSSGGIEVIFTTQRSDSPVSIPDLDVVSGCKVDRTCGLHVHVDVRDLTRDQAKEVYNRLQGCRTALKLLVPASRHRNRYCRWRSNANGGSRYAAINFDSYRKFRTIEFRCQSGSTERAKIEAWAEMCYQLVQWARSSNRRSQLPWKAFMKVMTPELRVWAVKRRVKLYQPHLTSLLNEVLEGRVVSHKSEAVELRDLALETILRTPRQQAVATGAERSTSRILGHSVCSVLRRMGQLDVTETVAQRAMTQAGVSVEAGTIRFMLRAGANGTGKIAPLTWMEVDNLTRPF